MRKTHQAIHYLDHRPLSLAFQEAELANEVGLSASHLHKIFLKEVRMTPVAYWNNRKLTATKSKLAGSSQSIKAIAFEVGFSSPENFTHWFRSHTGQSPSQFRIAHLRRPRPGTRAGAARRVQGHRRIRCRYLFPRDSDRLAVRCGLAKSEAAVIEEAER